MNSLSPAYDISNNDVTLYRSIGKLIILYRWYPGPDKLVGFSPLIYTQCKTPTDIFTAVSKFTSSTGRGWNFACQRVSTEWIVDFVFIYRRGAWLIGIDVQLTGQSTPGLRSSRKYKRIDRYSRPKGEKVWRGNKKIAEAKEEREKIAWRGKEPINHLSNQYSLSVMV